MVEELRCRTGRLKQSQVHSMNETGCGSTIFVRQPKILFLLQELAACCVVGKTGAAQAGAQSWSDVIPPTAALQKMGQHKTALGRSTAPWAAFTVRIPAVAQDGRVARKGGARLREESKPMKRTAGEKNIMKMRDTQERDCPGDIITGGLPRFIQSHQALVNAIDAVQNRGNWGCNIFSPG